MQKFIFIILIVLFCALGAGVQYLYKRSAIYLAFNHEARQELVSLVNAKHKILPNRITLAHYSPNYILAKPKEQLEKKIFVINKRDEFYYLDSHGGIRLFLNQQTPVPVSREEREKMPPFGCSGNFHSCRFTTFTSEDAKIIIIIRHDDYSFPTDPLFEYSKTNAGFYIYELHDGVWISGVFPSHFFPNRPKGWGETSHLLELDYGAMFRYLGGGR